MTRRRLPRWLPGNRPSATKLNQLSEEIGRLTGQQTGGEQLFVDNAAGRFYVPSKAAGSSVFRMIVTETIYGTYQYGPGYPYIAGQDAYITRTSHIAYGFAAKRVDRNFQATGSTINVRADMLVNVLFTGDLFLATRENGVYAASWTGENVWTSAITQEAFDTQGLVELYAGGPIVLCSTDTPVAAEVECHVKFDNREQIFMIDTQLCPTAPEYGY